MQNVIVCKKFSNKYQKSKIYAFTAEQKINVLK